MKPTVSNTLSSIDGSIQKVYEALRGYQWSNPRAYAQWLAQTYFYTRHASRVSAHAALRTPVTRPELHDHFIRTLHDEKDHPPMAIADLRELGFEIGQFEEHPLTSCFYQTLHYQIDTVGPFALIGYFFVIEGAAARFGREIFDEVSKGTSGRGVTFLEEHVIADAVHFPLAQKFVTSLEETELAIVAQTASLGSSLYAHMVRAIRAELVSS